MLRYRLLEPLLLPPTPHLIRRLPLLRRIVQPSVRYDIKPHILRRSRPKRGTAFAAESAEENVAALDLGVFEGADGTGDGLGVGYLLLVTNHGSRPKQSS